MEYIVTTPCGPVQGTPGRVPGTVAYKGIRYATAGRWEYPQTVTHWDGIYDATRYGHCAYQTRAFVNEAELSADRAFYYKEFRQDESYTYSEDCLFLNIFAPDTAREGQKLPVLFYIHGGGFTGGCGHEKHFDGPVWPTKGVIGVTINYRLGPLGFLALPELKDEAGCTGNYGLYDQVAALEWVKRNIASFGGDPENITIMGQSAGAMSVQQLVMSPMTHGLFQKAVMSSGGGVNKMMGTAPAEKGYAFGQKLMEKAGCANLAELRALEPKALYDAFALAAKEVKGMACAPCIDGRLVVGNGDALLKEGKQHAIPYMAGSTSHDMMPPFIYQMAKSWCAAQAKPSYTWFFDRMLPGDKKGAWHSSDLWYWFGTLPNCWRPMEKKDYDLSDLMVSYLCNFAKSGNPNGENLPTWDSAGNNAMWMGEKAPRMGKPSTLKLTYTMLTNAAAGER